MRFWDLLYHRYGDPMPFLDLMLRAGQFSSGIDELIALRNKELEEKTAWEFYLHRVFDQSFEEFQEEVNPRETAADLWQYDSEYVETTIQKSKGILKKLKGFS